MEIGGCGDFQLGPAQQWWVRLFFFLHQDQDFENSVFILRLVFILSGYQSCYWNRYQHFADCSLDIETGIKTLRIAVFMLRLVSRHSELQYWYRDWYQDFQDCSLNIKTGIMTFFYFNIFINMCLGTFKTFSYMRPLLKQNILISRLRLVPRYFLESLILEYLKAIHTAVFYNKKHLKCSNKLFLKVFWTKTKIKAKENFLLISGFRYLIGWIF